MAWLASNALNILRSPFGQRNLTQISELLQKHRVPTDAPHRYFVENTFSSVGQESCEAVPKDGNRLPRRAGACLPPIDGGRKARRYAELETAPLESMCSTHRSNELMSQPPCTPGLVLS